MSFYTFNPQYPEPFSLIHPLRVKSVMDLINTPMPSHIDGVILFGSSLDLSCTPFGDVDLYVLSDDNESAYKFFHARCKALKIKSDIIVSDTKTFMEEALDLNTIERQILKQGVVVYEKESHAA